MLDKVKKIGIIIIIAILFSMFSLSIVDLVVERPEYNDFCRMISKPYTQPQEKQKCSVFQEASEQQLDDCFNRKGYIEYRYDANGCPVSFECNTCQYLYEQAGKTHRLYGFIITSIMGVIAIVVGMYVKSKKEVVEWVMSGFLIGGIAAVFIGTVNYFRDMGRYVKPIVLILEMALIVWIAIKTAIDNTHPKEENKEAKKDRKKE